MGLESVTYISDFNTSNPAGGDLRSQGDNHIRNLKVALTTTFPNADRVFRFPNSVAAKTGDYSVLFTADHNKTIPVDCSSGAITVTLPDLSAQSLSDGFTVIVCKVDQSSNAVTVSGSSINGFTSDTITRPYQTMRLTWCATIAVWLSELQYVVPVGSLLPYSGTSSPNTKRWVMVDGVSTIGNASSSATIAAAYTRQLFEHFWNIYSNSVCAVSTGRGLTAAADYAAAKRITTPDLRGRVFAGLDTMNGQAAASRLGTILTDSTVNGGVAGTETFTLLTTHMPAHAHSVSVSGTTSGISADHTHTVSGVTSVESADHTHSVTAIPSRTASGFSGGGAGIFQPDGAAAIASSGISANHTHTFSGTSSGVSADHNHTFSVSTTSGSVGSGTAHSNLQPTFLGSYLAAF